MMISTPRRRSPSSSIWCARSTALRAEEPVRAAELGAMLRDLGGVLGILRDDPEVYLRGDGAADGLSDAEIDDLIQQRQAARAAKNWAEADRVRGLLTEAGILLEDGPQGTTWRRGG